MRLRTTSGALVAALVFVGLAPAVFAATENVIGDPQTSVASGLRLHPESANDVIGFEVDGTYYEGAVTIYPAQYPVQYHIKPVLKAGKYLFRNARKKGSCGLSVDDIAFPNADNTYWMVPPPKGAEVKVVQ